MTHGVNRSNGPSLNRQLSTRSKISLLKGLWRFMGFKKVQLLYTRSHFEDQKNLHRHADKQMSERQVKIAEAHHYLCDDVPATKEVEPVDRETPPEETIVSSEAYDDVWERFEGFRATKHNIRLLYQELAEGGAGRFPDEPENAYRLRLKLSMLNAGLATIPDKGEFLTSRPFFRSISSTRLHALEDNLGKPLGELINQAYRLPHLNKKILNRRLLGTPENLGISSGLCPLVTPGDLAGRLKICGDYLMKGEGRDILEKHGFAGVNDLEKWLPEIPAKWFTENAVLMADSHQGASDSRSATPTDTLRVENLEFLPGCTGIDYDPRIPEQRFLAIMQELQLLYTGVYDGANLSYVEGGQTEQAEALFEQVQSLNRLFLGMNHAVMKQAFPDSFASGSYQQLVLRGDKKYRAVRWNSDIAQPRPGWCEKQTFKPVTGLK